MDEQPADMAEIEVYGGDWTPEQAVEIRPPGAGYSMMVSREQWAAFVRRVKAGEFDNPGRPNMTAVLTEDAIFRDPTDSERREIARRMVAEADARLL
jgi:hypothetical protein